MNEACMRLQVGCHAVSSRVRPWPVPCKGCMRSEEGRRGKEREEGRRKEEGRRRREEGREMKFCIKIKLIDVL